MVGGHVKSVPKWWRSRDLVEEDAEDAAAVVRRGKTGEDSNSDKNRQAVGVGGGEEHQVPGAAGPGPGPGRAEGGGDAYMGMYYVTYCIAGEKKGEEEEKRREIILYIPYIFLKKSWCC